MRRIGRARGAIGTAGRTTLLTVLIALVVAAVVALAQTWPWSAQVRPSPPTASPVPRVATRGTGGTGGAELAGSVPRASHVPQAVPPIDRTPSVTGWALAAGTTAPSANADQGMATVIGPSGAAVLVTRGRSSIPTTLRRAGWVHIGDPGSSGRYLVDAYQGRRGARAKMFLVTAPNGRQTQLIHALVPGEAANNSFAAISPDGRWLVSGEWNTISRLLVFAMPTFGTGAASTVLLPLATTVSLTHPMRDVQGCAFDSATDLICSTDDPGRDLYPVARQFLAATLTRPLDGRPETARPTLLGSVPQQSACPGYGETEGMDISGDRLRVAVIEPGACRSHTRLYTYVAAAPRG